MGSSPHTRRDSQASAHNEQLGHGPHGQNRGGFAQRGGRGSFNHGQYNNPQMGYPPPNRYNNAPRAGGIPNFQPRGGGMPQQYSPQPHRASPATAPAMPHVGGTPTMQPAALAPGQQYFAPGMGMNPYQVQVKPPFLHQNNPSFKQGKKSKGMRNGGDKQLRPREAWEQREWQKQAVPNELTNRMRRSSKR